MFKGTLFSMFAACCILSLRDGQGEEAAKALPWPGRQAPDRSKDVIWFCFGFKEY